MRPIYSVPAALAACLALGACATVNSSPIDTSRQSAAEDYQPARQVETVVKGKDPAPDKQDGGDLTAEEFAEALKSFSGIQNSSRRFDQSARKPGDQAGIAYFLPRQLVKVKVSRESISLAKAVETFSSARLAVATAEAAVAAAKQSIISTKNAIVDNKDSKRAVELLEERLAEFTAAKTTAETTLAAKTKALDEATVALERARRNQEGVVNTNNLRFAHQTALEDILRLQAVQGDAVKARDAANTAYKTAQAALAAAPQDATLILAAKAKKNALDLTIEAVASAEDQLNLAQHRKIALGQNLARALTAGRNVDGIDSRAETAFKVTVELSLEAPTADPDAGYRMDSVHNIFRDDGHKFTLTGDGLITSTDTVAVDRTGEVIVELATFAGALAAGLPPIPKGFGMVEGSNKFFKLTKKPPVARDCSNAPLTVTGLVDLTRDDEVARLNDNLVCLGARIEVRTDAPIGGVPPRGTGPRGSVEGIAYRTPVQVLVDIKRCEQRTVACVADDPEQSNKWVTGQTIAMLLPQAGPTSFVRQNAGFGTRSHYGLTFKDGILLGYDSDRPSEALQVASLPMKVVNGVFAGVSQVISLRTGVNGKTKDLIDSHKGVEEAKTNLAAAALAGDKTMFDKQLEVLKAQLALQNGQVDGAKTAATSQFELAKAIAELQAQGIALPATASTNQLNATLTMMRNEARLQAVNKCIAEKIAAGTDYQSCFN